MLHPSTRPAPELAALRAAAQLVHAHLSPTPQYAWPQLAARAGCEVWVKHENHLPVGAFKVRGGLVYFDRLQKREPNVKGVIAATRGNHGQSVAFAASRLGMHATIVVPRGNSREKNAAMRALGAELAECGDDFAGAFAHAATLAVERGLHFVPSFDPDLVDGVASYALELFDAVSDIDTVYVPIGLGSGAAGLIAARDALGLRTRIVGVVATGADAYARSFEAGYAVETERADTFADGIACRVPDAAALAILLRGLERVVRISDDEIANAIRALFSDTHNTAEGAGAAAFAALMHERERMSGKRVAVILCGGNIDRDIFARILAGSPTS
ncbi:MAG: threonine dehydratase [Candidatus Velthaea sp.]